MSATVRPKTYVRWFALSRCFPITHKVFVAYLIAIASFNIGLLLVSIISPTALKQWILASQPFTEWVSPYIPAMDYATESLRKSIHDQTEANLAIRNAIAINFTLYVFPPFLIFGLALGEAKKRFGDISEKFRTIFGDAQVTQEKYMLFSLGISGAGLLGMYFGPVLKPRTLGLQVNFLEHLLFFYLLAGFISVGLIVAAFTLTENSERRKNWR